MATHRTASNRTVSHGMQDGINVVAMLAKSLSALESWRIACPPSAGGRRSRDPPEPLSGPRRGPDRRSWAVLGPIPADPGSRSSAGARPARRARPLLAVPSVFVSGGATSREPPLHTSAALSRDPPPHRAATRLAFFGAARFHFGPGRLSRVPRGRWPPGQLRRIRWELRARR